MSQLRHLLSLLKCGVRGWKRKGALEAGIVLKATKAMNIFVFLKSRLEGEPPLRPVEGRMARRWVKERLKRMYPELRHDPRALEAAYQSLSLEAHKGCGEDGAILFEVLLPGKIE